MRKIKKHQRTGTERSSELDRMINRIGGSGGAAYRSSRSTRPDILKLKNKPKPLTTKSDAAKMVRANKKATRPKKKNYAGRAGVVARKAAKVGAAAGLVAVGYGANQWINQKPAKKK